MVGWTANGEMVRVKETMSTPQGVRLGERCFPHLGEKRNSVRFATGRRT